jgi:hypothetical protein
MAAPRRLGAFDAGRGIEAPTHECAECGFSHTNRKNFKRSEDGEAYTCSTGHYQDKEGNLKRQANFYAQRRR